MKLEFTLKKWVCKKRQCHFLTVVPYFTQFCGKTVYGINTKLSAVSHIDKLHKYFS